MEQRGVKRDKEKRKMNKKLLFLPLIIITIFLAFLVVGDLDEIIFDAPAEDDIISGDYSFNSTIVYNTPEDTNVTFYYNISEEQFYLCNCTNGTDGQTLFNCTYDTIQLTDGIYNFTVFAIETENPDANKSDVAKNVIVDNNAPEITLIFPEDSHANQSSNINFTYTPSDVTLSNCSLNGSGGAEIFNAITNSPINNFQNVFTQTSLSEGIYMWNISCKDSLNRETISPNRNLTIDITAPNLDIGVANGAEYGEDEVNCSCYATDNLDPSVSCSEKNCTSSVGEHIAWFWAIDDAGNLRNTTITYSVYEEPPAEGESEGEAEGESGYNPPAKTIKTEEKCWDTIEAGANIDYDVEDDDIGIRKITIVPNAALSNACLKVKQVISITTAGVTKYDDDVEVYKYFQIEPTGISDEQLTSVIIEFSVSKSFFYDHKRETTALNRYKEGWKLLSTEDLSQDYPNYAYFKANSPGFSDFVVTGKQAEFAQTGTGTEAGCGDGVCDVDENSTNCCKDCGCPLGYECKENVCEKSSKFIVFQWIERAWDNVKDWVKNKFSWFSWFGNKWWLGLPIWAWILIGVGIVVIALLIILFKKKIKFPFEIDFAVKRKSYGFK